MSVDRETWYRVPRSAEECAMHLEAGGVVEVSERLDGCWRLAASGAEAFRDGRHLRLDCYRLVYSTPVGMSPVIGAPSHAYGLARNVPTGGWQRRAFDGDGFVDGWTGPKTIIEARPPAPAPEPRTEPLDLSGIDWEKVAAAIREALEAQR